MENDNKNHGIEETVSLEKIAEIVEMYIQEDDDAPEYDGYDVSIEEIEEKTTIDPIYNDKEDKKIVKKKKYFQSKKLKENIEEKAQPIEKEVKNDDLHDIKEDNNEEEYQSIERVKGKVASKSVFNHLKRRYKSIDIISGIALISIIFSSGVGISNELPKFFMLSKWNGITFGDLGIPLILLSMCFMIPTEVEFDLKNKLNFKQIAIKKIKIAASMFLIGIVINFIISGASANFRIMGILQFIAIVYMFVSLIYIIFKRFKFKVNVIGVIFIVLGVFGSIGYFVISEKFGYDMSTCLAYIVDSKILIGHFNKFERLGIISTLAATLAGLLSAAGGSFICDKRSEGKDKCIRILIVGMFFIIISLILERKCTYNVNIWSPSFIMLISGSFLILLSFMLFIFDIRKFKELDKIFSPLVIFGSSPIFLIAMNELLVNGLFKIKVYSVSLASRIAFDKWVIIDMISEVFGESSRTIIFVLLYILVWFAITLIMYGKRIFIRIK